MFVCWVVIGARGLQVAIDWNVCEDAVGAHGLEVTRGGCSVVEGVGACDQHAARDRDAGVRGPRSEAGSPIILLDRLNTPLREIRVRSSGVTPTGTMGHGCFVEEGVGARGQHAAIDWNAGGSGTS